MTLFKLYTNEGERFVRSTPTHLRAAMMEYIREKRSNGYTLAEVIYCWTPLHIAGTI